MKLHVFEPPVVVERPVASLLEISRVLEETASIVRRHASAGRAGENASGRGELITAALVRSVIAGRRLRRDHFPSISGDPAWSMMLELYAAQLEGRRVSQTLLGTLAGVAETTALRLTKTLLRKGTFTSHDDPDDRRLIMLGLSEETATRMRAYLTAAIAAGPLPA